VQISPVFILENKMVMKLKKKAPAAKKPAMRKNKKC